MLGGFQAVNREKLKALPGDTLAELAATDELELIYLHLQSMRNFDALRDRMVASRQVATRVAEPRPEAVAEDAAA
jgi:SapC